MDHFPFDFINAQQSRYWDKKSFMYQATKSQKATPIQVLKSARTSNFVDDSSLSLVHWGFLIPKVSSRRIISPV